MSYPALFDSKTRFPPSSLKEDANNQYLLSFPAYAPPYFQPSGKFALPLPGGLVRVVAEFYANPNALVGAAVRANVHPVLNYDGIKIACWDQYPWCRDGSGDLSKLAAGDMQFRNSGGHGTIVNHYQTEPSTQGSWLYFQMIGVPFHFQYNAWVNAAAYRDWYDNVPMPPPSSQSDGFVDAWQYTGVCDDVDSEPPNDVPPADPPDNPLNVIAGIIRRRTGQDQVQAVPGVELHDNLDIVIQECTYQGQVVKGPWTLRFDRDCWRLS